MTDDNKSIEDMEINILKDAVEHSEKLKSMVMNQSKDIENMVDIVENFIKKKGLICYGGTAINNILPQKYQFYDKNVNIPDYDIYSTNPLEDSKDLADIYAKKGFSNIEVRTSIHEGTYKVSVIFISIVDITYMDPTTFDLMKKDAVVLNDITYAPVNYLRMSMYKELSRPNGDISRWEKVFTRLNLLNNSYPLKNKICDKITFNEETNVDINIENKKKELFENVKDILIKNKSVFIGEFATSLYGKYMSKENKDRFKKGLRIEILSGDIDADKKVVKAGLKELGYKHIKVEEREPIGHIIDVHYEITVDDIPVCLIYKSEGCYNYNTIKMEKREVKVATIYTIMTFLLAAMYTGRPYYSNDKLLCMAQYLFIIQNKNRLVNRGLLKRFSLDCVGYEESLQERRLSKAKKYRLLKKDRSSKEFQELFFKYNPNEEKELEELLREEKKNKKKNKTVKLLNSIKNVIKKKTKIDKKKTAKKKDKNLLDKIVIF
jgi:hypothetical protein